MRLSMIHLPALLTVVATLCHCKQDITVQPGTHGQQVVSAVVDRIRSRCVFPEDRLFLRRIAYVMSRDGAESETYRAGFHGGIWKVTEDMFNATKNCSNVFIQSACANISASFGVHWPAVTWSELRKPLYSGLAASLYTLLSLQGNSMPGNISAQSELLADMYGEETDTFGNDADSITKVECNDKLDLVFVLDSSGSIVPSDFQLMLQFAADVIDAMNISSEGVLVAGISYSFSSRLHFDFDDYTNGTEARNLMLRIRKVDGGTYTHFGLNQAADILNSTTRGARTDAKKVVVLVTDGKSSSTYFTANSAQALKDQGTTVFAVGVGNYYLPELKAVASEPTCSHVLTLTSFDHIQSILTTIQKSTCEANSHFSEKASLEGKLTPQESRKTGQTRVPAHDPEKPKTIEASVSCGILDIYVSTTDPKPGPAVYDDRYMATPDRPAELTITETQPSGTPLYITVVGTRLPASAAAVRNCSDYSWTLGVVPKKNITVVCEEDGIRRPCTSNDVTKAGLCEAKDDFEYAVDNPCTAENLKKGLMRHPYPYNPTKFLQCDMRGQYYVTSCPGGVTFNTESRECGFTSPVLPSSPSDEPEANQRESNSRNSTSYAPLVPLSNTVANPCTARALANNEFYHEYPSDKTKYIQCDQWGNAWVRDCAQSTVWSQSRYTCIKKAKASRTSGSSVTCSATDTFLPDPCDHHAYYRCVNQQAFRRECHPKSLFFDPATMVCGFEDTNTASIPAGC